MSLVKSVGDVCSWCIVIATILHWMPELAATASFIWAVARGAEWIFDDGPQKLRDKYLAWKQRHWGKKD